MTVFGYAEEESSALILVKDIDHSVLFVLSHSQRPLPLKKLLHLACAASEIPYLRRTGRLALLRRSRGIQLGILRHLPMIIPLAIVLGVLAIRQLPLERLLQRERVAGESLDQGRAWRSWRGGGFTVTLFSTDALGRSLGVDEGDVVLGVEGGRGATAAQG